MNRCEYEKPLKWFVRINCGKAHLHMIGWSLYVSRSLSMDLMQSSTPVRLDHVPSGRLVFAELYTTWIFLLKNAPNWNTLLDLAQNWQMTPLFVPALQSRSFIRCTLLPHPVAWPSLKQFRLFGTQNRKRKKSDKNFTEKNRWLLFWQWSAFYGNLAGSRC